MSIKQSFSWRKASQSLEPGFWGIKKSYICLLTFWKLGLDRGSNDKICFKSRWISERDIFGTQASKSTKALKDFEAVVFPLPCTAYEVLKQRAVLQSYLGGYLQRNACGVSMRFIYIYNIYIYMRLPEDRSLFPQSYLHGLKDDHLSSFVLVFAVVYPFAGGVPLISRHAKGDAKGWRFGTQTGWSCDLGICPGAWLCWDVKKSLFWSFHEKWYLQDATWWCVYIYIHTRIYIVT